MDRLFKPIIRKPMLGGAPQRGAGSTQHVRRAARGQGMVEFALVLPMLLLLIFGIMELGRLLVIYTSVQAASREGARYGSAAGLNDSGVRYYQDIAGIRAAAQRIGMLINLPNNQINVNWDRQGVGPCPNPNVLCRTIELGDRVIVTVSANYAPLLGLTPLRPFTFTSVTRRTIVEAIAIGPSGHSGGGTTDNPPVVAITTPDTCPFDMLEGVPLNLEGAATDVEDGLMTSEIVWYLDGAVFGGCSGGTCTMTGLSAGTHTVLAQVTDSDTNTSVEDCEVIVDPAPVVEITAPANGADFLQGFPITFSGTASEFSPGDLSGLIQWTSSLNGNIGNGATFSRSDLALGLHTITATVTDLDLQTGSDMISIVVEVVSAPQLAIVSPADGARFAVGDTIVFSGHATDASGGDVSGSIAWNSSRDGPIGIGPAISRDDLSEGDHVITASIPALGISATISIRIVVNAPPVVTITSPANGGSYSLGGTLTFTGTAIDDLDGNLSNAIHWSSSGGQISHTGASFQFSTLPLGTHIIYAEATDSRGATGSTSITITIINDPPVVTIDAPTTNTYVSNEAPVNFRGTARDIQDGLISSLIQWSRDNNVALGSGASITTTISTAGTHTITASATDSGGATGSASIQLVVWQCPSSSTPVWTPWNNNFAASLQWSLTGAARNQSYVLDYLRIDMVNTGATISSITVEGFAVPNNQIVVTQNSPTSTTVEVNGPINIAAPPADNTNNIDINFVFGTRPRRNQDGPFNLFATIRGCTGKGTTTYPTYP
jgi:Flp pilus assembly protein TadG